MRIENTGIQHYSSSKWKKESEWNAPEVKKMHGQQEEGLLALQKEAKEMTSLLQGFQFEDAVREDKLLKIKEQIETGHYQISGKDVVSKLMGGR